MKKNGVPTEAQVKAAIQRGNAAVSEMEGSLAELRDLSEQLNVSRNEVTDRLARLLSQPPQMAPSANMAGRNR